MKFVFLFLLLIPLSYAQLTEKLPTEEKVASTTKHLRQESLGSVMIGYQFFGTWLPSKKTISYTHIFNEKWSLEGEYSWSTISFPVVGIDLGEIKEQRYTLQARHHMGNSFHLTFGAVLSEFKARLGSDFLDDMGNEITSDFKVENIGLTAGIGNRWQWQNGVTVGIDWFRVNIPLFETELDDNVLKSIPGSEDQDEVEKVIRVFNHLPSFVVLGVNIGYTF